MRGQHNTVDKLLHAVIECYRKLPRSNGRDDLSAKAANRFMMKLSSLDGRVVGGRIRWDEELLRLAEFRGPELFGQIEIG